MVRSIPAGAPDQLFDAFGFLDAIEAPTPEQLKVMVLIEAAGKPLYEAMAQSAANDAVRALLLENGREELAHAHRCRKAILAMTGEDYSVPEPGENPYLQTPFPPLPADREALLKLAEAETAGDDLYGRWARNTANPEAAEQFRLNGREELGHGDRLRQAAALLG